MTGSIVRLRRQLDTPFWVVLVVVLWVLVNWYSVPHREV
jgi:hypothetical protein